MKLTEQELAKLLKNNPKLKVKDVSMPLTAQREVKEFIPIVRDEKVLLEDAIQATVIEWALHRDNLALMPELDMIYAIPNARKTSQITGHIFNLTGRRKGFPDLGLPVSRKPFFSYFIEVKTWKAYNAKNHSCTVEQIEWHEKLRKFGNRVDVLWSVSDIIRNIKEYLRYENK